MFLAVFIYTKRDKQILVLYLKFFLYPLFSNCFSHVVTSSAEALILACPRIRASSLSERSL
jgi:hypothetical protein